VPTVVLLLAVLAVTKGPVYRVRVQVADLAPGADFIDDRWVQATFVTLYAALIAVSWPAWQRLWVRARAVVITQGVFVGVIAASALWSIGGRRSAEQALMLMLGTAAFLLAGARFSSARALGATWGALQIGTSLSVVAGALDWRFAIDRNGDLAGIYFNRNSLGAVAALGVLTSAVLAWLMIRRWHRSGQARHGAAVIAVVAGGVVDAGVWVRSGSLTPAFAVIVAVGVGALVLMATRPGPGAWMRRRVSIALAAGSGIVVIIAVATRAWLTELLGRSPTFSGRTEIWAEVIEAWQRRPIGGFGWMAVWFDPTLRTGLVERRRDVYEAHSGYVEVLVGAGAVGAVALAAVIVVAIMGAVGRVRSSSSPGRDPIALWCVMAMSFVLAANLGETYVGANLMVWSVFVMITAQSRMRRT
jgi:exopolysaccharide production protein ExoQ